MEHAPIGSGRLGRPYDAGPFTATPPGSTPPATTLGTRPDQPVTDVRPHLGELLRLVLVGPEDQHLTAGTGGGQPHLVDAPAFGNGPAIEAESAPVRIGEDPRIRI